MINNKVIGQRIAALRQERRLTQQQLSAQMNVTHQAVSKWENGSALPDLQTLLNLTEFFGITVEQLCGEESSRRDTIEQNTKDISTEDITIETKEDNTMNMNIQQLMQMAPYMTKEAVEEIAMGMEKMTANEIAKVAPYIHQEAVAALIRKHQPELNWDVLRKLAPFMPHEEVDALARSIASGDKKINASQTSEDFNKTMNDIGKFMDGIGKGVGKAFDDIGKGVGSTVNDIGKGVGDFVQKAVRFGGNVINDVSNAINDMTSDPAKVEEECRAARAAALRKKAIERAIADGKWDWLEQHCDEINEDKELKAAIIERAKGLDMDEWLCRNIREYIDEAMVDAALNKNNWEWLGDSAWQMASAYQKKVALAAAETGNWEWLVTYSDQLSIDECANEICEKALDAGQKELVCQIAQMHLDDEQIEKLAESMKNRGDTEALKMLAPMIAGTCLPKIVLEYAEADDWQSIAKLVDVLKKTETVEKLMELAVERGNFEAIDMLDKHL